MKTNNLKLSPFTEAARTRIYNRYCRSAALRRNIARARGRAEPEKIAYNPTPKAAPDMAKVRFFLARR